MGTIDTYSFLIFFGIGCRMAIVIVFLWALCRINRLVAQLQKYGFVESRTVLYAHLAVSIVDLFFNAGVGLWTFLESVNFMMAASEKYEGDLYRPDDFAKTITAVIV